MLDVGESWRVLANFDDNQGNVVGERPLAPRSHAVKNGLSHFRKRSFGRLAYQRFQALDAYQVFAAVKDLGKTVRVEYEPVARCELNLICGLGPRDTRGCRFASRVGGQHYLRRALQVDGRRQQKSRDVRGL